MSIGIFASAHPLSSSSSGTYEDELLADSPIAFWKCDESSGDLADSSGNGVDLSAVGSPVYGQTALGTGLGTSVLASGGHWQVTDGTVANLGTTWTVTALVRMSGSASEGQVVGCNYINGDVNWSMRTPGGAASIQAAYYDGGWYTGGTQTFPTDGTVRRVVARRNGTELALWQDTTKTTGTGSANAPATGTVVLLGRRWDSSVYFPGDIGYVAVYDSAISDARISAWYSALP